MQGLAQVNYKVVLLGESRVGKTSLVRRYVLDEFNDRYLVTLGAAVSKRTEFLEPTPGTPVQAQLMVWDIQGNGRIMEVMGDAFMEGARGALMVFDVCRSETLGRLASWVDAARRQNPRLPMVVLGNKCDLDRKRRVDDGEARAWCRALGLAYLPTSAKTGENVGPAFRQLGTMIYTTQGRPPSG